MLKFDANAPRRHTMPDRLNVPDRSLFTGDNLDILRYLNSDSEDLIYVAPPRNTGKLI